MEDLIAVNDSESRLIALHCRPGIVILVPMNFAGGGVTGIDMGRVVEHDSRAPLRGLVHVVV